jgi:phenylalanine-4-hydroxylase
MQQNYESYKAEDHQVWSLLFNRQVENLKDKAVPALAECLTKSKAALHGQLVPNFKDLDQALETYTGWSIKVVPGLIPVEEFFELLAQKRFPSSTWLRSMKELDYLEEPDMFHDIFGHIPLLFDEQYANFMQDFGRLGLLLADRPEWVKALERLYWFTIEFGISYNAEGRMEIIGAGIISSFGESNQIYEPESCEFRAFDLGNVLNHVFYKHEMQSVYYVLPSYEAMFPLLDAAAKRAGLPDHWRTLVRPVLVK